jgi:nickel/cobalt transporter (NicO) family protein
MTTRPRADACRAGALAVSLLLAADAQAHRLDEYLQAARLSLSPDRVLLDLDLSPGVAVAPEIIGLIDRDADQVVSPQEAREYGQQALSEIALTLDGRRLSVILDRVEIPSAADLRAGLGTIALRAGAAVERLPAGRHELRFRNDHHPGRAAYLINALHPEDPAIQVASQQRDPTQREGRIAPSSRAHWLWLFAGLACFHRHIAAGFNRLMRAYGSV